MAKKVGDLDNTEQEEKVKGRQDYDSSALVALDGSVVDGDGLLTVAPSDYDCRKNNPLKKEAFASESIFIRYQALVAQQRSDFYTKRSAELTGKADRLEKFGSEIARKTANKLIRAKAAMTKLREQLLETGMDPDELDALINEA